MSVKIGSAFLTVPRPVREPDLTAVTNRGLEIDLYFYEDYEGDDNRGFIAHYIQAFQSDRRGSDDDHAIAYMCMNYVPQARFDAHCPDIFAFLSKFHGKHGLPADMDRSCSSPRPHWKYLDRDSLELLCDRIELSRNWLAPSGKRTDHTRDQLLTEAGDLEWWAIRKFRDDHAEFVRHQIDRPKVDYIRVVDEPLSYRGMGVSTTLYMAGALWMERFGLFLHASTLQSPEAIRAWDALGRRGWVRPVGDGSRRVLDSGAVREAIQLGEPGCPQFTGGGIYADVVGELAPDRRTEGPRP
jgi:hypothetical protein